MTRVVVALAPASVRSGRVARGATQRPAPLSGDRPWRLVGRIRGEQKRLPRLRERRIVPGTAGAHNEATHYAAATNEPTTNEPTTNEPCCMKHNGAPSSTR